MTNPAHTEELADVVAPDAIDRLAELLVSTGSAKSALDQTVAEMNRDYPDLGDVLRPRLAARLDAVLAAADLPPRAL